MFFGLQTRFPVCHWLVFHVCAVSFSPFLSLLHISLSHWQKRTGYLSFQEQIAGFNLAAPDGEFYFNGDECESV